MIPSNEMAAMYFAYITYGADFLLERGERYITSGAFEVQSC